MQQATDSGKMLVARSPLLDSHNRLFGYRVMPAVPGTAGCGAEPVAACPPAGAVCQAILEQGFEEVSGGEAIVLSVRPEELRQIPPEGLPADRTLLELRPRDCRGGATGRQVARLAAEGHRFSLADPDVSRGRATWPAEATFASFDLRQADSLARLQAMKRALPRFTLIARHVEGPRQAIEARKAGADLLDGYHFTEGSSSPARIEVPALRASRVRLLAQLAETEVNLEEVAVTIRSDPALSLELLKLVNSAGYGVREEVASVAHAVRLVGLEPLKRWASGLVVKLACVNKPTELIRTCIARAIFCEMLAERVDDIARPFDGYLAGLLSAIEAAFDCPAEQILHGVELPEPVVSAVTRQEGPVGGLLRLIIALERDHWTEITRLTGAMNVGIGTVGAAQAAAHRGVHQLAM